MNHSLFSLISGLVMYLNPFHQGFSRKMVVIYCSRLQGPTGLWVKLPRLHYYLYNCGKEHLLQTDVELQVGKIEPSKKSLVLITDDIRTLVGGVCLVELVKGLKSEFNVVIVYLHESPRNVMPWRDVVTVGPLERGDLGAVVAEEIKCLQKYAEIECVLTLSLESGEVLPNIWESGLPNLHYIPEFLMTHRQIESLKKSCRDSTIQLFPTEEFKIKAMALTGGNNNLRNRVLESASPRELISELKRFSKEARDFLEDEKKQASEIKASGIFDPGYAYPQIKVSPDRPIRDYLGGWRSGWKPRKPCPGFHPGIYRDHHPDLEGDPLVHFIERGKPNGPWLTEVLQLNKTKKSNEIPLRKAAIHLHLHYTEGMEGLLNKIKASRSKPDLFISTTSEEGRVRVQKLLEKSGMFCRELEVFPNRGRDIGSFLTGFGPKLFSNYEIVGHIHSKKSPHAHDNYLQNWVEFLEQGLIGNEGEMMDVILDKMASDPSIGIVYPDDPGCFGWEENYTYGKALIERIGYNAPLPDSSMNFPVGTMFWARTAALKPLLDLNLQWEEYPEEPLPIDGSMLHALERIFGILSHFSGYRTVVTTVNEPLR
jgi:Rhamnan synthesis protein F